MRKTLFALAAALLASSASADRLVTNVNGVQVGSDGRIQHFRALVITDDGRVRQTIEHPELFKLAGITETVDGGGRTLLPGLIDAHGHVMGLGFSALQLDLVGSRSLEDLKQRLSAYAAANPDAPWIIGRGWNQELWPDKRFPTAADLDSVASDRPVVLERVDGHATVVNSAALKAAGVTAATRDPVGGKLERDARGNPTGLLIDAAADLVGKKIPEPTAAQRDAALAKAQELLLASGLTAVADMGTSLAEWTAMQRAGTSGRLKMRILSYATGPEMVAAGHATPRPTPWRFDDRLQQRGVKFYADGALGSRGAWLKQPYADKQDTRGLQFLTDAELRRQAGAAAANGYQLAIHAIGDAANAQVISAYEELARKYGADRRWRIEHFQVADPQDIPRLAKTGIIASMQPTHQTSDRLMAEKRLGPNRLTGAYAWQSVLKSGARLAFGSDFPVESPNPFPGLAAAITRQDMEGQPPGGWIPAERLSFPQALDAFTRAAAYAGFAEDRIGSLEPGKWADFIIIDRDPTKVDAQSLARTQVLETWVAGKKAWARAASAAPTERGK
ncbi:MAG TPA: amidohydrolase family protein [Sphingomicrobium sp.]|nr:amidohydrolase family protein [Sphingomicrobium sp.]